MAEFVHFWPKNV